MTPKLKKKNVIYSDYIIVHQLDLLIGSTLIYLTSHCYTFRLLPIVSWRISLKLPKYTNYCLVIVPKDFWYLSFNELTAPYWGSSNILFPCPSQPGTTRNFKVPTAHNELTFLCA